MIETRCIYILHYRLDVHVSEGGPAMSLSFLYYMTLKLELLSEYCCKEIIFHSKSISLMCNS